MSNNDEIPSWDEIANPLASGFTHTLTPEERKRREFTREKREEILARLRENDFARGRAEVAARTAFIHR